MKEFKVDANSGQIVKIEDEYIRGRLTNFVTGTNLKDLETVKTTFSQAVGMAERQAKAARARGRTGGRPRKLTAKDLKTVRSLLRAGEVPVSTIAEQFRVARSTLYRNVSP